MGRGRKGPIDQSVKKPKILKNKVSSAWPLFTTQRIEKKLISVSEELLAEMKKMSPQDLKNALINPCKSEEEEDQDEYELIDLTEDWGNPVDWSHTPEPVYERPIPTRELAEQMMTMSKEQVREIIVKCLAN